MTTETKRDLAADLVICEAATAGPWIRRAEFDRAIAKEYTLDDVVSAEGDDMAYVVIEPSNEHFILEAREGWPHAIKRAMAAEKALAEESRMTHRLVEAAEYAWENVRKAEEEAARQKESYRLLRTLHDEQCARSAEYYGEIQRLRAALGQIVENGYPYSGEGHAECVCTAREALDYAEA